MTAKCSGNCPFGRARVDWDGDLESPFVIVGESPGVQEVRQGKPFIGPSGELLFNVLNENGVTREDVLITNSMACKPVGKSEARMNKACEQCRPRVLDLIGRSQRKVILLLGNYAVRSILGTRKGITNIRGIPEIREVAGQQVVLLPAVHPAALLRGTGSYRQFRRDIAYACELAKTGISGIREFEPFPYTVMTNEIQAREWAFELRKHRTLVADVETSGFSARDDHLLALGVSFRASNGKAHCAIFPQEFIESEILGDLFDDQRLRWVWHNGKFDIQFLQAVGLNARVDEDTMLLSYALDERGGVHDLEQVGVDLLNAPRYKDMLEEHLPKKGASYSHIPPPVLHDYLSKDCSVTLGIYEVLSEQIKKDPLAEKLYRKTLIPASAFLADVESHGLWVSEDHLLKVREELEEEVAQRRKEFQQLAGYEINPNSPQQVSHFLFHICKIRAKRKTTNKDDLKRMPKHPAIDLLLAYRKVAKQLSTYVKPALEKRESDGRIHATYLLHGTATGRLASRKPNLQNIPRASNIRSIYAAPPGRAFVEPDLDQAELRCLAILSRDDFLCGVYRSEHASLHDEVSIALFGEDYTSEQRMRAKAVNFGIVYGRQAPSLAEEFGIPLSEAQRMIDAWFERAPGAKRFIDMCRKAVRSRTTLRTPFGRQKRFTIVSQDNFHELQNEAANFPHQSIASDITLHAAMKVKPVLAERGAFVVNLVHDSILVECNDTEEDRKWCAQQVMRAMVDTAREWLGDYIPFKADAKQGTVWGDLEKTKWEAA